MDREQGWRVAGVAAIVMLGAIVAYGLFVPERSPVAAATQQATPTPEPEPTTVVFLGDSYTAGAATTGEPQRWVNIVAAAEGWEVVNLARGGTGFVNGVEGDTAQIACGLDYCPSFTEMIGEVVAPDIIVVSGGRNDATQTAEDATAGVTAFYAALEAAFPDTTVYSTNVLWDDELPPETVQAMSSATQAGVTANGGTYLDIGQPLQGHPELLADDGVHPNNEGHAAIAQAVLAALG